MSAPVVHDVVAALRSIRSSIDGLMKQAGRTNVRLLAVAKTKPSTMVIEAYKDGQIHFGENYVNELVDKAQLCPPDIKWHFIGHLQSNKAAKLVSIPNLYMVESVDSLKLAKKLDTAYGKLPRDGPLNILVQVNTSGEESKSGCEPDQCLSLFESILAECPNLKICGLMTIGQYEVQPTSVYFNTLNNCRDEIFAKHASYNTDEWVMSMGMSHDMDLAISCGSTEVRVGTAIFGTRGQLISESD